MRKRTQENQEVQLSITPLIDVTFLLLIFFMCAMKFKTLERKLQAQLPRDKGIADTLVPIEDRLKITVGLKRDVEARKTTIEFMGEELGDDASAFVKLDDRLKSVSGIARAEEMPGEIDAQGEVPHADVIRVVDSFLAADLSNIEFVGAKMPGTGSAR